jgi:predicted NBD/HSP70 family sugar kinase
MRTIDLQRVQAATSETARAINRRIVLNLIRSRQPISRADLARLSGLQRSTVSLIIEQLLSDGLVTEGLAGRLPRGRRPTYLRLNEQRAILGVDIRPGNTTIAISDVNGRFSSQEIFPTAKNQSDALNEIASRLRKLMKANAGQTFEGVGVSLPGRIDPTTQRLVFAPNLNWNDCDLKKPIARATGLDVALENAANACALAEVWFGREGGAGDLIVVTVSEGIGTGIFMNGQLVRGPGGMGGEFGHTVMDPTGPVCSCGNRGCWEVFASNTAAIRNYLEIRRDNCGLSFHDILAFAANGDVRAVRCLERQAEYLGRGASILANALAPSCIVFVGELTYAWPRFGPIIEREISARCLVKQAVRVSATDDGSAARLRGTIALVLEKHFGMPTYY